MPLDSQNQQKKQRWVLLPLSLFLADLFLYISIVEFDYGIHPIVKYFISVTSLAILLKLNLKNHRKVSAIDANKIAVIMFFLWSFVVLITSPFPDIFYVQKVFAARYYFIPYLLPLLILTMDLNVNFYISSLKFTFKLLPIAIIVQLIVLSEGATFANWFRDYHAIALFQLGAIVLIYVSPYYRGLKVLLITFVNLSLFVLVLAVWGRRGLTLELVLVLILAILMRLFNKESNLKQKCLFLSIILFASVLVFLVFDQTYSLSALYTRGGFTTEAIMASRGAIWTDFIRDFDSLKEWVFGRGLNGTVLRTINNQEFGIGIETGYLHIILKGGLLYLIPMLWIYLRSAYLGFFRSQNDLLKAFSLIIILQFYNLAAFGMPDFSSKYILVWLCVSGCFSETLRNLSNQELRVLLNRRSFQT